ncbi:MAG: TPM domain-containing protein [Candidatus Margulisiibacteriota bacterium]
MKCPKCKASVPEWKKGCQCGHKFDFKKYPAPPKQIGLVNDYEAIIGGEYTGKMIKLSSDFEKKTGIELIVVVIGTTKPLPPENYAFYLFNKWKLGKKKHEAILILVSMFERRIETEIGFGLENKISEEFTEKLLDEIVVPYFKQSKYGEGLYESVKKLISEMDKKLL